MQNDLISRKDVEHAIKEFSKKRICEIPKGLSLEEHSKILDIIEEENCEMLKSINNIPTAYNVKKVVEQLKNISKIYCEEYHQRDGSLHLQDAIEIVRNGGKE